MNVNQLLKETEKLLKKSKESDRSAYFERKFSTSKSQRQQWCNLNDLLGRSGNKNKEEYAFVTDDSQLITDPKVAATHLNKEWKKACRDLASRISATNGDRHTGRSVSRSIFLEPVTETEVYQLISNFKPKTCYSAYGLNMVLLKKCSTSLVRPLTLLANKCLETGIYPQKLKLAKVISVFKGGDKHNSRNFRPISILQFLSLAQ